MCGIYGFVGKGAVTKTINGLKKLEYRGYDSAGIAFFDNCECDVKLKNNLKIIKQSGELKNLIEKVNVAKPKSSLCLGHTRWATHGEANQINSHPHYSQNLNWCVVHNGIIENYLDLKNKFDLDLKSKTDTEVIAQLLQHFESDSVLNTIKQVVKNILGSFAIAVVNSFEPDAIYVIKRGSPAVVGVCADGAVVCSDVQSVNLNCKVHILNDCTIVKINKQNLEFFDFDLNKIKPPKSVVTKREVVNKTKFKHNMLKEIYEIPTAVNNTIDWFLKNKVKKIKEKNILIIGCGTAYNAGLVGKSLLENKKNVWCEIASEFVYSNKFIPKNTVAIFVSQSGETADTIKALKKAKEKKLKTIVITNVPNSTLSNLADRVIYLNAGPEIGVASTKAYNCQVVAFYLLNALNNNNLKTVCNQIKNVFNNIDLNGIKLVAKQIVSKIKNCDNLFLIGRGLDYLTCLEGGLKIKEITYKNVHSYPAGELKHGTISLLNKNSFVFCLCSQNNLLNKNISNISECVARSANVITLSQNKLNNYFFNVVLPNITEVYYPLISVIYFQFVAYFYALELGHNPDKPRALAKSVTVE